MSNVIAKGISSKLSDSEKAVAKENLGIEYVGTVSQTAGVPTGAIIERGSNVNGEYVKYADGTMICTHKATGLDLWVTAGTLYRSGHFIWTFPSLFVDSNSRIINSVYKDGDYSFFPGAVRLTGANGTQFVTMNSQDKTGVPYEVQMVAIGRWY